MSQPYHPYIQPPSEQSAVHQDACGIHDNLLYNAWKILAQIHATLTVTLYDTGHWPLDTRQEQIGADLHQLGETLKEIADRRDMAWNYYVHDAKRQEQATRTQEPTITRGTCTDCGGSYLVVSNEPDTLHGLCDGCYTDRKQAEESDDAPDPEQLNDEGEPYTDTIADPIVRAEWPF
jgi:hypothetical protein